MNDIHDNNSLDCWMLGAYIPYQAVGRSDRTHEKIAAFEQDKKEITMHANGHTTVWGTHIGVGRAQDAKGWSQQLRAWWAAHKAMRRKAQLTTKPLRADAAADLIAPAHARSTAMALCDLAL